VLGNNLWRTQYNETDNFVLFTKYYYGGQVKEDEIVGGREEMRDICKLLVGKLDGKRPFGRLKHRWDVNI